MIVGTTKIYDTAGPISAVADKSKYPRQSAVSVEYDEKLNDESSSNATDSTDSSQISGFE